MQELHVLPRGRAAGGGGARAGVRHGVRARLALRRARARRLLRPLRAGAVCRGRPG